MPLLEVTDLDKTFTVDNRSVTAIDRLSLSIDQHEFVSIVGPSGCGKSTFLHILGGFEPASGGDLRLNGRPIGPPGPDRGMMFQELSLFPWLTAIENVAWPLEMKGLPKRERLPKAAEYLDLVHLARFADLYPGQLSGGMKQRVALARLFALDPEIMLMDEPFGALDSQTRELLQEELQSAAISCLRSSAGTAARPRQRSPRRRRSWSSASTTTACRPIRSSRALICATTTPRAIATRSMPPPSSRTTCGAGSRSTRCTFPNIRSGSFRPMSAVPSGSREISRSRCRRWSGPRSCCGARSNGPRPAPRHFSPTRRRATTTPPPAWVSIAMDASSRCRSTRSRRWAAISATLRPASPAIPIRRRSPASTRPRISICGCAASTPTPCRSTPIAVRAVRRRPGPTSG